MLRESRFAYSELHVTTQPNEKTSTKQILAELTSEACSKSWRMRNMTGADRWTQSQAWAINSD